MTQHRARKTGTVFLLLLSLLALYGHRCDYGYDQESTDEVPPDDCPSWDSDCDMISTAVETNDANGYLHLDTNAVDPNPSIARGYPCNGYISNALNMVNEGMGYYHYNPEKIDRDDWGVLHTIYIIEAMGRDLGREYAWWPRIGVGDLSWGDAATQQFGGSWPGGDHACHQNGLEVDVRYVRNDGVEGGLNIADDPWHFDEDATTDLISYLLRRANVDSIFVNGDYSSLDTIAGFIVHKGGHSDHFHVRIVDPDGTSN